MATGLLKPTVQNTDYLVKVSVQMQNCIFYQYLGDFSFVIVQDYGLPALGCRSRLSCHIFARFRGDFVVESWRHSDAWGQRAATSASGNKAFRDTLYQAQGP